MTFDKRQTNIAKGVAVLMLLWHHLFFNTEENYKKFISIIPGTNVPIECYIYDFYANLFALLINILFFTIIFYSYLIRILEVLNLAIICLIISVII